MLRLKWQWIEMLLLKLFVLRLYAHRLTLYAIMSFGESFYSFFCWRPRIFCWFSGSYIPVFASRVRTFLFLLNIRIRARIPYYYIFSFFLLNVRIRVRIFLFFWLNNFLLAEYAKTGSCISNFCWLLEPLFFANYIQQIKTNPYLYFLPNIRKRVRVFLFFAGYLNRVIFLQIIFSK